MKTLLESCAAAKAASTAVARLTTEQKNAALLAMADALEAECASVLAANKADMDRERANGMSEDITRLYDDLRPLHCVLQFVRSGRVAITTSYVERVNEYLAEREAKYHKQNKEENHD